MATRMGSPGVRIELHDKSGYSLVETPNAVAGVVGFAPRGELNKIQTLTNTAEQDMYFGLGFNNPRYNQGMYAARAVINAGGHVEFVRPYGEEIDKTDDFKRDLKTDTYVVAFDRDAIENKENPSDTSLKMEFFASTRYKEDGASRYGAVRKINSIAETIVNNSNVDFSLDASEEYNRKENWVSNKGVARGKTDTVLFAIMNADPSGANRAYNVFPVNNDLTDSTKRKDGTLVMTCTSKVGFAVDDIVYGNLTQFKILGKFVVTNIVERKVTIEAYDEDTKTAVANGAQPEQLIYSEGDDAVNTGSDYLTVKTAVAGAGAKTFSAIQLDTDGLKMLNGLDTENKIFSGTPLVFVSEETDDILVRVATPNFISGVTLDGENSAVFPQKQGVSFFVGDVVTAAWGDPEKSVELQVTSVEVEDEVLSTYRVYFSAADETELPEGEFEIRSYRNKWVDALNTPSIAVTGDSTVKSVVDDIIAILHSEDIGYGVAPVIGDIVGTVKDTTDAIQLIPGAAVEFTAGDKVAITRASTTYAEKDSEDTFAYKAFDSAVDAEFEGSPVILFSTVRSVDPITNIIVLNDDIPEMTDTDIGKQLVNLSQTNRTVFAAKDSYVYGELTSGVDASDLTKWEVAPNSKWTLVQGSGADLMYICDALVTANVPSGIDPDVLAAGEFVQFTHSGVTEEALLAETPTGTSTTVKFIVKDVVCPGTESGAPTDFSGATGVISDIKLGSTMTKEYSDVYMVGNFTVMVPRVTQDSTPIVDLDNIIVGSKQASGKSYPFQYTYGNAGAGNAVVDRSEKVLTDTVIGSTFVGLGLANIRYMDINFTGKSVKAYDLTDEGEAVARLYLSVAYMYNGIRYEFDGTIVKYVYNDMQLYIGDTADRELTGSGVKFVLNDSGELDWFLEDNSYDLSSTVAGGKPSSTMTCVSFNVNDPAIINNAVWTYDPKANMNTSTLSNAFNLFIDKDKSDVSFFVGAGLGVSNFGLRKYEALNTQLMQSVLNICELRKDCFALFDGVAEPRIEQALKLDSPASRFGSTLGRWGAIYDARPIFSDRVVTMSNVEAAPSIAMASLITANRRGGVWWNVPAGEDTGMIPGAWCSAVKYERSFNIPEDPDSDIARLCDIHVNPFRTNRKGIYAYGDYTMQMEDTAFNAINVTMLVAGIHKMFYNYLDSMVFRLNTAALRSRITSDLQSQLDAIKTAAPAGLEFGEVICNDTNNTPEVIEAHKLYVDLNLIPTSSSRYITLRTNVLSRSNGNTITTEITTSNR